MPAGHHLRVDHRWRKTVLAALAKLRPVVAELETMLAEARVELAKWEQEERRTAYVEKLHGQTKDQGHALPVLVRRTRKPHHQFAVEDET